MILSRVIKAPVIFSLALLAAMTFITNGTACAQPLSYQTAARESSVAAERKVFVRSKALHHLESRRAVIFAAGTGNPFFTTDTTAALRAVEMNCEALAKATQVDGIYTSDPKKDPNAQRLPYVTYQRVLAERLQVMDAAAIDVARNSQIPIYIFSLRERGNSRRALLGEQIGSLVSDDAPALAARG